MNKSKTFIFHNLLNDLQTLSLDELDKVKLLDRFDTKFVFNQIQLPLILEKIKPFYRILEINNLSSGIVNPPEDWVELHNPTDEAIVIGLWTFKDNNDGHVFTIPVDQILKSGQYLILCEDTVAFKKYSLDVGNFVADFVGDFVFGLKSEGDQVRLFDISGLLVDKVEYDNITPWPIEPDGTGSTLELIHPSLDNTLGENWAASNSNNGTPGEINSVYDDE